MAKRKCIRKKRTASGMRCAKYSGTKTRKGAKRKTGGRKRGRGTALGRAAKACKGKRITAFRACMKRKLKK